MKRQSLAMKLNPSSPIKLVVYVSNLKITPIFRRIIYTLFFATKSSSRDNSHSSKKIMCIVATCFIFTNTRFIF